MKEWFYLTFGFALFFILLRGEQREDLKTRVKFSFLLFLALSVLAVIDQLGNLYLWRPLGRQDFRLGTLFLWAILVDQGIIHRLGQRRDKKRRAQKEIPLAVNPTLVALLAFSLWMMKGGSRLMLGLTLPLGTALFEWLLEGLRDRLRLANLPRAFEEKPILFWLAMLLVVAFSWLEILAGHL